MMWTGDHDSDEGGELGLMVSWRCINEECEVRAVDVHWSLGTL
jgi:hypothetical protein